MSRRPPRCRHGFSLVELTIVLLLTSICAAVALPRWANSLQSFRAASAARRIAADLALAQSTAYSSSSSRTVTFSTTTNGYTLAGVAPLGRSAGSYVISLADDPYRSVLVSAFGQSGEQSITFDGYGKASRSGTIIVSAGGVQKSVVVNADAGTAVVP